MRRYLLCSGANGWRADSNLTLRITGSDFDRDVRLVRKSLYTFGAFVDLAEFMNPELADEL